MHGNACVTAGIEREVCTASSRGRASNFGRAAGARDDRRAETATGLGRPKPVASVFAFRRYSAIATPSATRIMASKLVRRSSDDMCCFSRMWSDTVSRHSARAPNSAASP